MPSLTSSQPRAAKPLDQTADQGRAEQHSGKGQGIGIGDKETGHTDGKPETGRYQPSGHRNKTGDRYQLKKYEKQKPGDGMAVTMLRDTQFSLKQSISCRPHWVKWLSNASNALFIIFYLTFQSD